MAWKPRWRKFQIGKEWSVVTGQHEDLELWVPESELSPYDK